MSVQNWPQMVSLRIVNEENPENKNVFDNCRYAKHSVVKTFFS